MAKFCGKCGARLDEKTGKCLHCEENRTNEIMRREDLLLGKQTAAASTDEKTEKHAKKNMNKKKSFVYVVSVLLCAVVLLIGSCIFGFFSTSDGETEINTQHKLLNDSFTELAVMDESSALEAAKEAAYILNLGNAADELTLERSTTVDDTIYYRFQQNFKGIPVYGRSAVVIADNEGTPKGFSSNIIPISDDIDIKNAMNDDALCLALSQYYDTTETDIKILSNDMVIYGTELPELCHRMDVQIRDTSFAEVIISAKNQTVVALGLSPNPETCVSAGGVEFNGSRNKDGKYVLMDLDDNFYCFTANGEATYSYEKGTWNNNSVVSIYSDHPTFYNAYTSTFAYAAKLQAISNYYTEIFSDAGTEHFALIMDSGTGTTGGLMPIEISADLKEICADSDEIGVVQIGVEDEDVSFWTLAHEYTHVITNNNVHWKRGVDFKNEAQVINEAYSDLFGMIINQSQNADGFMWDDGRTDVSRPSKENYPTKVNKYDAFLYEATVGGSSDQKVKAMWVTETDQAYTYTYAVTIEYAAYLMSQDHSKKGLTIDELAELWYKTMLTLPSDCNFVTLRNNMEMTASVLGFSKGKIKSISKAFDKIDVHNNECLSTDFSISVYNEDFALYSDYTVIIDGEADVLLWGMIKRPYHYEQTVTEETSFGFKLPEGEFTITVTDGINNYSQEVTVKRNGKNKQLTFMADFKQCDTPAEENDTPVEEESDVPESEAKKQLTRIDHIDKNGDVSEYELFSYDENGNIKSIMGSSGESRTLTYDANGKLLWAISGKPVDACEPMVNSGWGFEYDDEGNLVKEYFWEEGCYETIHQYDDSGKRVRSVTEYDQGTVTEDYTYDEEGVLIKSGTFSIWVTGEIEGVSKNYDYRCKPFVVSSSNGTDTFGLYNDEGISILKAALGYEFTFEFVSKNSQYYLDEAGYLQKVVEDGRTVMVCYYDEETPANDKEETKETKPALLEVNGYADILDMYYTGIACQWTNRDEAGWQDLSDPDSVCFLLWHYYKDDSLSDVGYALMDLNGDGQDELLIGRKEDANEGILYGLYTIVDETVVSLVSPLERDRYKLAEDGTILNDGSGSAITNSQINYYLDSEQCELRIRSGVLRDGYRDETDPFFSVSDEYRGNYMNDQNNGLTPITEQEANAILDNFPDPAELELIPFAQYK